MAKMRREIDRAAWTPILIGSVMLELGCRGVLGIEDWSERETAPDGGDGATTSSAGAGASENVGGAGGSGAVPEGTGGNAAGSGGDPTGGTGNSGGTGGTTTGGTGGSVAGGAGGGDVPEAGADADADAEVSVCASGTKQCGANGVETCVAGQWSSGVACGAPADSCCDGECFDLESDPDHCGRCGHPCLGGDCTAGVCQPVTIATGQAAPGWLGVSDTDVFWVNGGDTSGVGAAVMKAPLAGGAPVPVISEDGTTSLRVRDGDVYWTSAYAGGSVRKMPLAGGPAVTVSAAQLPGNLAVNASTVYITSTGPSIKSAPSSGGTATTFWSGQAQCPLTLDDTRLYWATPPVLYAAPLGGGVPVSLVSSQNNVCGIAADATNLFWTDQTNSGNVMKADLDGGNQTALASGRPGPQTMAVDATHVYWTENGIPGGAPSALVRVPRAGGQATTLHSWSRTSVGIANGVILDANAIYWVIPDAGWVMKVAKP